MSRFKLRRVGSVRRHGESAIRRLLLGGVQQQRTAAGRSHHINSQIGKGRISWWTLDRLQTVYQAFACRIGLSSNFLLLDDRDDFFLPCHDDRNLEPTNSDLHCLRRGPGLVRNDRVRFTSRSTYLLLLLPSLLVGLSIVTICEPSI